MSSGVSNPVASRGTDRAVGARHAAAIALIKVGASAAALASGFRAVSDDDFARVVIAQGFARAPRLDPSGTSWLPAPFWIAGAAMAIAGRSLEVARATAFALGVASSLAIYVAARWITREPRAALVGAAVAAIFPWSARLGVATVPELPTAALALLAMASLVRGERFAGERRIAGGAALFAATLSRYETWPIALGFALLSIADARRAAPADRARLAMAGALALAGPTAWIGWNRFAHGDAFHFVARVTAFKKALGGAEQSPLARLVAYPVALVREEPGLFTALAFTVIVTLALLGLTELRGRVRSYARPAALALFQIAALSLAMVKDGAPTHHPERAVLVAMLLVAIVTGDLAARLLAAESFPRRIAAVSGGALVGLIGIFSSRSEGLTPRADEVAAGRVARGLVVPGERVLVEVVDYGHMAIVAALGRPEDAILDRSIDPRDARVASSFDDPATLAARASSSGARWAVGRASTAAREALGEPVASAGPWAVWRTPTIAGAGP